jgi:hypothetical protein
MAESAAPTAGVIGVEGTIRLGDVFGKSFRLYGRHFVAFSSLAALAISPFYLAALATLSFGDRDWVNWTVVIAGLVCPLFANGVVSYGVVRDLHGRPAPMLETLHALARRFLPLMLVAISVALLAVPDNLLTAIPLLKISGFEPISSAALGAGALLPPTAIVFSIFFVAAPVCVTEQAGIGKSLWRSRFLTKGYRLQIFGTLLLIRATYVGANAAASAAALSMQGYTGRLVNVVEIAAGWMVETVFIAFLSVVTAVFYYQLRVAKDGGNNAKIADAFD